MSSKKERSLPNSKTSLSTSTNANRYACHGCPLKTVTLSNKETDGMTNQQNIWTPLHQTYFAWNRFWCPFFLPPPNTTFQLIAMKCFILQFSWMRAPSGHHADGSSVRTTWARVISDTGTLLWRSCIRFNGKPKRVWNTLRLHVTSFHTIHESRDFEISLTTISSKSHHICITFGFYRYASRFAYFIARATRLKMLVYYHPTYTRLKMCCCSLDLLWIQVIQDFAPHGTSYTSFTTRTANIAISIFYDGCLLTPYDDRWLFNYLYAFSKQDYCRDECRGYTLCEPWRSFLNQSTKLPRENQWRWKA